MGVSGSLANVDDETQDGPGAIPKPQARAWAWVVCWLMFASTTLNYMDRQAIAIVGPQIKGEYHLSNSDFGWVLASFAMTYALFQVPAGYLVDRWSPRWVYAGAVAWWSLAAIAAAYAPTLGILMALRALLGVGESFNWPCALRVTRTILPPAERSLGNGIFNSGAAVGAVLTPLIVTPIAAYYGWRRSFLVIGVLGFVWVGLWLALLGGRRRQVFVNPPRPATGPGERDGRLSPIALSAALAVLASALAVAGSAYKYGPSAIWFGIAWFMTGVLVAPLLIPRRHLESVDWTRSLADVVRVRRFWVMMVVSISVNICWHFLMNWLPTYTREDLTPPDWLRFVSVPLAEGFSVLMGHEVSEAVVGMTLLVAFPFVAADIGNLVGGVSSRMLARRGLSAVNSRLVVMGICTLFISSGALVSRTGNSYAAIYLLSCMAMGTAAFMANYFSFAQETSARHTGLIVGILGAFGNLFAAGFLPFAGWVRDRTGGFAPIFLLVGLAPFLGLAVLIAAWGPDPVDPDGEADQR